MNINLINNLNQTYGLNESKNNRKTNSDNKEDVKNSDKKIATKADSLEISTDLIKINEIKSRLADNYYDKADVIDEVANRLIEFTEI